MAKRRYGRKVKRKSGGRHRKSAKRVAAGRKAWRTKVRRYGSKAAAIAASFGRRRGKRRGRKGGHGRKRARRGARAAGLRLVRYNKLAARIGKRRARAQVFGRAA